MNTNELNEIKQNKVISKKELLEIANKDPDCNIDELKKMKVSELRELFKITHVIDGKYKNYTGYCFSCLRPLKPDYIRFENYCLDC
jgi:hypothetical protein